MQVTVIGMKTLLGVRVPVAVRVLFSFLALMVIGILPILVEWVDFLVAFSNPDGGVIRGWYGWVSLKR